jgi:NitT/TauT family transport system ATP-binding protein
MSDRSAMLNIDGVAKAYALADGSASVALLAVHATIAQGEFVSFVGPSGCGKTTLLKICAGLVSQSQGAVTFSASQRPIKAADYGFVFQAPALLPWRTVLSNVLLPADIMHLSRKTAQERARRLLDLVHLAGSENKYPRELSGGMQQRVAIARALLHDPAMLFMDEPFGALDAMTRESLNDELQQIHLTQNKTVLFVTHDIEEAVLLSDRILVMSSGPGRVVADVTIPLPRPRDVSIKRMPAFYALTADIRTALESRWVSRRESKET